MSRTKWILGAAAIVAFVAVELHDDVEKALRDPHAVQVAASDETDPVESEGDAADDPAIFVDRTRPERSLILGTDKDRGLGVYDLEGNLLQFLDTGHFNNVDVRDRFPLGGQEIAIAAACETSKEAVAIFRIDPEARRLVELDGRFELGVDPAGLCLSRTADGRIYVFVTGFDREVEEDDWLSQWELLPRSDGSVGAKRVRRIRVSSACEGLVADDEAGVLYLAEENVGIWSLPVDPASAVAPRLRHRVHPDGKLHRDVEGLALADTRTGSYLIASSQGSDDFVVFRRDDDLSYVTRFELSESPGIDRVTHTDGIEAFVGPLGHLYPAGLFIAQDDENDDGRQNFKLVCWSEVTRRVGL